MVGYYINQAKHLTTDKGNGCCITPCERQEHRSTAADIVQTSLGETADPETDALGRKRRALVSPVHTVTLLLGDKVVPATILGIQSNRVMRGHRFMGEPKSPSITPISIRKFCVSVGKHKPLRRT
ncbi:glycine--tRNA ligase subunit beta [Shigella flexneri]